MAERREPPPAIEVEDLGDGQRRLKVEDEVERLKRLGAQELRREALDLKIPMRVVRRARSDTEVRQMILERKLGAALGGDPEDHDKA